MGTSKSYKAPTTPEWKKAKGSLTRYLKSNGDNDSRKKAVSDYANAHIRNMPFQAMASAGVKIAQLYQLIDAMGTEKAFIELGLGDLIGKSTEEVLNGIIEYFSNGTGDLEDAIIKSAIAQLLIDFDIMDISDLNRYSFEEFFMKFIVTYIEVDFKTVYYEKIMADRTPDECRSLIENINTYIEYSIKDQYNAKELAKIDWKSVEGRAIISAKCKECYELLLISEV